MIPPSTVMTISVDEKAVIGSPNGAAASPSKRRLFR